MNDIEKTAKRGLTSIKYKSTGLLFSNAKVEYLVYEGGNDILKELGYTCNLDIQYNVFNMLKETVTIS